MKFLIINEYKSGGGTEQSVCKIKSILSKHGHHVTCLYMNIRKDEFLEDDEYVISVRLGIFDKLFYNPILAYKFKAFLRKFNPDIVLLNNVFSAPITVLSCLNSYKTYQFIRDYSAICPKGTCVDDFGNICSGYRFGKCYFICKYHNSKLQLLIKLWLVHRVDKLRQKNIIKCFPPGKLLSQYMLQHGHNSVCINNPIDSRECNLEKVHRNNHKYIYIGAITDNKGVFELIKAFKIFLHIYQNVELHMYGKCDDECEKKVHDLLKGENNSIFYHGFIAHDRICEVLCDGYALVVPSKWLEAFGNTVLEGMANRILVLGSNRGGILEQLSDGRGLVFDISVEGIYDTLEKAECMSGEEYNRIVSKAYEFIKENNSYDKYYHLLMSELKE